MMSFGSNRRVLRAALLLILAPFAGCAELPPPEFVSKEYRFRAQFGGVPKVIEKVGVTQSTVYSVERPAGVFRVTITDLPIPADDPAERASAYLISAKDDLIRAARAAQTADASTTLAGKYPGRAFAATFGGAEPGAMRARIFLVGKRLYQVLAVGTAEYANSDAATAFLDSFQLTE